VRAHSPHESHGSPGNIAGKIDISCRPRIDSLTGLAKLQMLQSGDWVDVAEANPREVSNPKQGRRYAVTASMPCRSGTFRTAGRGYGYLNGVRSASGDLDLLETGEEPMRMTWPDVVAMLQQSAGRHGGRAFVREGVVVLSAERDGTSITVRDAGDDGVFIDAGWVTRLVAEAEDNEDEPPYCLQIVEAIMTGRAEESAVVDPETGTWIDTAITIRTPYGTTGGRADARPRYTRTLPAWPVRPS